VRRALLEIILRGVGLGVGGQQRFFLSGGLLLHNNGQVCPEGRGYSSAVGAAGIQLYHGGGRLCLSACPGDGEVKKIAAHPRP